MLSSGDKIWPKSVRNSEEVKFYSKNPLDTTRFSARFMLRGFVPVLDKTLKNAARVTVPTLVMNGDADVFTLTVGAQKLLDTLPSKDKTLKTFPDPDHYFYHTTFPKSASFEDDPAKRRQVINTVSDWITSHEYPILVMHYLLLQSLMLLIGTRVWTPSSSCSDSWHLSKWVRSLTVGRMSSFDPHSSVQTLIAESTLGLRS